MNALSVMREWLDANTTDGDMALPSKRSKTLQQNHMMISFLKLESRQSIKTCDAQPLLEYLDGCLGCDGRPSTSPLCNAEQC